MSTQAGTPTAAPATIPVQPKGAHGVTVRILNWDRYATDPVVLAFKQSDEAIGGSINGRKVLPQMRQG